MAVIIHSRVTQGQRWLPSPCNFEQRVCVCLPNYYWGVENRLQLHSGWLLKTWSTAGKKPSCSWQDKRVQEAGTERGRQCNMDSIHSQRSIFKRLGLLILKMSLGSRWLVARMWEVGPFQEHSVSSFPKMLSLDHTAARSDLDKAGPEGGCSPHSEPKGSAGHFSLWHPESLF